MTLNRPIVAFVSDFDDILAKCRKNPWSGIQTCKTKRDDMSQDRCRTNKEEGYRKIQNVWRTADCKSKKDKDLYKLHSGRFAFLMLKDLSSTEISVTSEHRVYKLNF